MDKSELLDWKMYVSPEESEAVQLKAFECEIYWAVPDNTPQVQWTKKDSLGIGDYGELCLNPVNIRRATTPYKWIALADKYLAQKNAHVNDTDVVEMEDWESYKIGSESVSDSEITRVNIDQGNHFQTIAVRRKDAEEARKIAGQIVDMLNKSNQPEFPDSSEAVKADEPDWDNAPEGTTHFDPEDGYRPWISLESGECWFWASRNDTWEFGTLRADRIAKLIPRPSKEAVKADEPDYDMSIHSNPDAAAWAKFYIETWPDGCDDEETMIGWFANAMMAMADSMEKPTQSPSDEWVDGLPPVGAECKYPSGGCGIVKLPPDKNGIIIVEQDGVYKRVSAKSVRPIKSKEEKHREELIDKAVDVIYTAQQGEEYDIAGKLYDAGLLQMPNKE